MRIALGVGVVAFAACSAFLLVRGEPMLGLLYACGAVVFAAAIVAIRAKESWNRPQTHESRPRRPGGQRGRQ